MRIYSLALITWLCACGGRVGTDADAGDAAADNVVPSSVSGVVLRACGPTDGIVHEFVFSSAVVSCVSPVVADDNLTISLLNDITGPTTINLGSGPTSSGGDASRCTKAGCTQAVNGTLTVTAFSTADGFASGSYTLTMPDKSLISATFTNIPICTNIATCG